MTMEPSTTRAERLCAAAGVLMDEARALIEQQLEGVPSSRALERGLRYQRCAEELLQAAELEVAVGA
jgi:hypothetical protein